MADSIIDSLVVSLGLDASKFTAGQKQAVASLQGFSTQVTDVGENIGASLGRLALKFTGFFLGFEGLRGVIDLLKDTVEQFKILALSSEVLGDSVRSLRVLGEMSRFAGGGSQTAAQYMMGLQGGRANAFLRGSMPDQYVGFKRIGVDMLHANLQNPVDFLRTVTKALYSAPAGYGATESGRAQYAMTQLGMPESTAAMVSSIGQFNKWAATAQTTNKGVTNRQGAEALDTANAMINLKTETQNLAAKTFPLLDKGVVAVTAAFGKLEVLLLEFVNGPVGKMIGYLGRTIVGKTKGPLSWLGHETVKLTGEEWGPNGVFDKAGKAIGGLFGELFGKHATPHIIGGAPFSSGVGARAAQSDQMALHAAHGAARAAHGAIATPNLIHGRGAPISAVPTTSQTAEVAIGTITINTQATDANGIASSIGDALNAAVKRKFWAVQADNGVTS